MKLTDLSPRWFAEDTRHGQGLTFLCPCCRGIRLAVTFANPLDGLKPLPNFEQPGVKRTAEAIWRGDLVGKDVVPPGYHWRRTGETFENLTLSPSVDASASGHWHGFVTKGAIT